MILHLFADFPTEEDRIAFNFTKFLSNSDNKIQIADTLFDLSLWKKYKSVGHRYHFDMDKREDDMNCKQSERPLQSNDACFYCIIGRIYAKKGNIMQEKIWQSNGMILFRKLTYDDFDPDEYTLLSP